MKNFFIVMLLLIGFVANISNSDVVQEEDVGRPHSVTPVQNDWM